MRICLIGKYPPIQGGVSTRTYWTAHALAARGHDVHVVTNAREVSPPFRLYMRPQDWARCEARLEGGSVTVHWTDPVDRSQAHIPMASPFVSKLASLAACVHGRHPLDVILSHYMEPYGVAGHLAAEMAGVPHVVRMAGSDAGRLWRHPQLEALYDHVLRSAAAVVVTGVVAERAIARGVDPARVVPGGGFVVPEDLFTPAGPALDLAALRREVERDPALSELCWGGFAADRPYFGIYGKLGEAKGSFTLLAAMAELKRGGLDVGLVALAHGQPAVETSFRARARELDVADRVLQIPFLPHWRVPAFLRGSLAVCCLEQNFPIAFHSPIIPLEVLLCGKCLVGSAEVIRKLPGYERLPSGYGCVAIDDVNDVATLAAKLAAIAHDRAPAADIGARGRIFAREAQKGSAFPDRLERILAAAAARQRLPRAAEGPPDHPRRDSEPHRFRLTVIAAAELARRRRRAGPAVPGPEMNLAWARDVLAALERGVREGGSGFKGLAAAVRVEIALAAAESEPIETDPADDADPLYSLRLRRWGMAETDFAAARPVRPRRVRLLKFDQDISDLRRARTAAEMAAALRPGPVYAVVFAGAGRRRDPLVVGPATARILEISDGTLSVAEIVNLLRCDGLCGAEDGLSWVHDLFVRGMIDLHPSSLP